MRNLGVEGEVHSTWIFEDKQPSRMQGHCFFLTFKFKFNFNFEVGGGGVTKFNHD